MRPSVPRPASYLTATMLLFLAAPAVAAGGGAGPAKLKPIAIPADLKLEDAKFKEVGDPDALFRIGDAYLAAGDAEKARKAYEAAYAKHEVNSYTSFAKKDEQKALLEGRLGNAEASEKLWDKAIETDVKRGIILASVFAPPELKEKLLAKAKAKLDQMVKELDAGKKVVLFTTSKGAPKFIEKWDDKRLQKALAKGDPINFAYLPVLDLSRKTLDRPLSLRRCIIGKLLGFQAEFREDVDLSDAIVLGEGHFGKRWEGEVNKSKQLPPARFGKALQAFSSVWLGGANFDGVKFGRLASFPFAAFGAGADFRASEFSGAAEYRFASFGGPANFKGATFLGSTYFGYGRYDGGLTFTKTRLPKNRLYFNSATIRGDSAFDEGEWMLGATFENASFEGSTSFTHNLVRGPFNFSRASFRGTFDMVESVVDGLDLFGAQLDGPVRLQSNQFFANVRFSIDSVTRKRFAGDLGGLDAYYKLYHGDEDVETEINPGPQYGVIGLDDLTAQVRSDISLANSIFKTFLVMEGVQFGTEAKPVTADFFNTQFGSESHFERTTFFGRADYQTIFGHEIAFNEATFHGSAVFDDANIPGRLTFTGAKFDGGDLSMYGAVIGNLGLDRGQIEPLEPGILGIGRQPSRLWYERCAMDANVRAGAGDDRRIEGIEAGELESECYARIADEYSSLRGAFDDAAQPEDADWAYWWMMHLKNWWAMAGTSQAIGDRLAGGLRYVVFEKAFGWGVHLGNIFFTAVVLALLFVGIYRVFCADSIIQYDGDDVPIREIPLHGIVMISVQSLLSMNIGWDGGSTDRSFKTLNTVQTIIGVILITFFVGAYTRMVLA